jgi:hypothetical protein
MQPDLDNPTRILLELDCRLNHAVELTLIGKSAIWLGYEDPPSGYGVTADVDTVVPAEYSEVMDHDLAFWESLKEANAALEPYGLYLSHIFEQNSVFLRADWASHRVRLSRPGTRHLVLFRPATLDLILTKMMRGDDPQHMEEIQWMITKDRISRSQMLDCLDAAVIPDDDPVWQELFETAKTAVLSLTYES